MDRIRIFILDSPGGQPSIESLLEHSFLRLSDACDAFGIANLDTDFAQMLAAEGDRVVIFTSGDRHALSIITRSGMPLLRLKVRSVTARAYCEMIFCSMTRPHHPVRFVIDLTGGEQ